LLESDAIDLLSLASEGALDEGPRALMRRILNNIVEERLDAEVCRFNARQAAVWPAATSGDLRALVVARGSSTPAADCLDSSVLRPSALPANSRRRSSRATTTAACTAARTTPDRRTTVDSGVH